MCPSVTPLSPQLSALCPLLFELACILASVAPTFIRVILLEAAIIVGLVILGRMFS